MGTDTPTTTTAAKAIHKTRLLAAALAYADRGLAIVPVPHKGHEWTDRDGATRICKGKGPIGTEWQMKRLGKATLPRVLAPAHIQAIGILTGSLSGNLAILDFDGEGWRGAFEHVVTCWPILERAPMVITGSGKRHVWLQMPDMPPDFTCQKHALPDLHAVVDLRGNRCQTLAPPSLHPDGGYYAWATDAADLPQVSFAELTAWLAQWAGEPMMPSGNGDGRGPAAPIGDRIAEGTRDTTLTSIAGTMRRRGMLPEAILAALQVENAARCDPPLPNHDVARIAKSVGRYKPAMQRRVGDQLPTDTAPAGYDPEPTRGTFHTTDLGNAERLVARCGDRLRYCHIWGKWLVWDSTRWVIDDCGAVERWARETVRTVYAEAGGEAKETDRKALARHAMASESRHRLEAMTALAQSEPGIPVRPDDLDTNPWLLNVKNGTIDLHTGALGMHLSADLITKRAPVDYDRHAEAPRWLAFLERIMAGNTELIGFLQRAVGYSLTANTSEQCLFILYGRGANGKSTFVQTLRAVLGDYGQQTPADTLLIKHNDTIPNDVAALKAARFVSAIEIEDGRRLAESLIKAMTGGDTLAARFLHREWFEFLPTFKLWLATNHKPVIRGTDYAIWRRIRLVPFTVTIPEPEQDKKLVDKLAAEAPGILAWAVAGCLSWQIDGLGLPPDVEAATFAYQQEMDIVGGFFDDCCVITSKAEAKGGELYAAYQTWCEVNGEKVMNGNQFARHLQERGFTKRKYAGRITYDGIGLAESASA